jgi:hypothetical protein
MKPLAPVTRIFMQNSNKKAAASIKPLAASLKRCAALNLPLAA